MSEHASDERQRQKEACEAVKGKLLAAHDELRKLAVATTLPGRQAALLHNERTGLHDALGAIEDCLTFLNLARVGAVSES